VKTGLRAQSRGLGTPSWDRPAAWTTRRNLTLRQTDRVTETENENDDPRSWLPIALAGGVVAFALLIAFFAYVTNDTGEPSKASSVDDVAELAIEAVDRADADFARDLSCRDEASAPYVGETSAKAEKSAVEGEETGSFRLTVPGIGEFELTVEQDGDRSCVAGVIQID